MEIQTVSATMEDVVSKLRAEIATVHENWQAESEARALSERLLGEKHESLEQVRHDLSSKGESLERAEAVATNLAAELAQNTLPRSLRRPFRSSATYAWLHPVLTRKFKP